MDDFILVTTTLERREDADGIARALVEGRFAACVQILGPLTSVYRWKGKVETNGEWLCLIKSRRGLYGALEAAIRALHPYETPEIVALPLVAGSADYLAWLGAAVASPDVEGGGANPTGGGTGDPKAP